MKKRGMKQEGKTLPAAGRPPMSERDLFFQLRPQIAKIIIIAREMTPEQYQEFKKAQVEDAPEKCRAFVKKVLIVIDTYL